MATNSIEVADTATYVAIYALLLSLQSESSRFASYMTIIVSKF